MVIEHKVKGYNEFLEKISCLQEGGDKDVEVNLYFTATKNEQGVTWCPDCNEAEPLVKQVLLAKAAKDAIFLVVDVGDRTTWKDLNNPFRKDSILKLTCIPTLLRWNGKARLECEECEKVDLLENFFTEN